MASGTGKFENKISAARLIAENNDAILKQWSSLARREIPAARSLPDQVVYNNLPAVLDSLCDFISTTMYTFGGERHASEINQTVEQHGRQRASLPGYTLDQVIDEYRLLRRVILQVLESQGPFYPLELNKLLEAIDLGVSRAATEFALRKGFKAARLKKARRQRDDMVKERDLARTLARRLEEEQSLRDQFISTLYHDLRTPLTAAKASAELIAKKVDRVELARKLSDRIVGDLERTDRMIRDLLDASRVNAGNKLPLHIEKTDLVLIAKSVLESLTLIYGDRFTLETDPELLGYWSGEDLRRVIENLAGNAVKYGAHDQPVVISLNGHDGGVELAVHNKGPEIPEQEVPRLFQSYCRMSSEEKKKTGWGLGLTLVKGITEAHGGRVWATSGRGHGTTFIVRLPWDCRSKPLKA